MSDPAELWIESIVQRVAELPDRTSPDEWPEAMLVTADELRSILREAASQLAGQTCSWDRADDETDTFETTCGHAFQFNVDGPVENGFKFCCYCGGKLSAPCPSPEPETP